MRPAQDLERERDRDMDLEYEREGDRPTDCFWEPDVVWNSLAGLREPEGLLLPLGLDLEAEGEWDAERLQEPGSRCPL